MEGGRRGGRREGRMEGRKEGGKKEGGKRNPETPVGFLHIAWGKGKFVGLEPRFF